MGAVKKKRQPTSTAIGKERTQKCQTKSGLAQKVKSVTASEALSQGKSSHLPDAEMIDAEPTVSKTTKIAEQVPEASSSKKGKEVARDEPIQVAEPSARKIAVPASKRTASIKTTEYPPELHAVVEAEKRRAEEIWAAIAQFVQTGPGSTPPSLPTRPSNPPPRISEMMIPQNTTAQAQVSQNTWATVARNGLRNATSANTPKAAPLAKSKEKMKSKTKTDKRLFLRVDESSDLTKLSLVGVSIALTKRMDLDIDDITSVQRVKSGFAITTRDETARQHILEASSTASEGALIIEPASNLVAYNFPTVPVALKVHGDSIPITPDMVSDEIARVSHKVPTQVRPHGTCKEGSPHQNWQALFPRESAPRPGFRLFCESGLATPFRPRRPIEQCKRCLGFHATRGCSRAPACWNCGSTMHSAAECKAPTRCRNCGGPHRSDCRTCLARPTRTGPVTKEQLVTIRQYGQREYSAVARAKAAARKAEDAAKAASADVLMEEGTGFGVLDSEEQI